MKKVLAWVFRLLCFAVIFAAGFTLVRCILHINDDHSYEALMGDTAPAVQSLAPATAMTLEDNSANEDPTVLLSVDGTATGNHPTVTVTAAFGNIESSIRAELQWYVNGELLYTEPQRLMVEGSTAVYDAKVDVSAVDSDSVPVQLMVVFGGKQVAAEASIPVEMPSGEDTVLIQTEEIPVTCIKDCSIYTDSSLSEDTGRIMYEDEVGLLIGYDTNSSGLSALQLQFSDGTTGWVSARRNEITKENCTTDQHYTSEQMTDFVNSMNYDSNTGHLVWVSLYTQTVNVFTGYKGNWTLVESFPCSSGVNESPTSTGTFTISTLKERWDLGTTYVEPVMIFNGGEAFTSQPYDSDTDKIADDTMGVPSSGGSVRMLPDDIQWMSDNLSRGTMVVVY